MLVKQSMIIFLSIASLYVPYIKSRQFNEAFEETFIEHMSELSHLDKPNPPLIILFSSTPGMGNTIIANTLENKLSGLRVHLKSLRKIIIFTGISSNATDVKSVCCPAL